MHVVQLPISELLRVLIVASGHVIYRGRAGRHELSQGVAQK